MIIIAKEIIPKVEKVRELERSEYWRELQQGTVDGDIIIKCRHERMRLIHESLLYVEDTDIADHY